MYKMGLIFYSFSSLCHSAPLPQFQAPICLNKLNEKEKETQKFRLAIDVFKAANRSYTDPEGLWNQQYLQENSEVSQALKEFSNGKRGQSLKNLHPEKKTVQDLHLELVKSGFTWKMVPLLVDQGGDKKYWKLDGAQTTNEKDPDVVMMHIYIHADGGMVRIKASGIPDKTAKYPKRLPHVVMAVLKKIDPSLCHGTLCNYDTSYDNEAFKVTREGVAGPKAPTLKYGFRPLFKETTPYAKEQNNLAEDFYMDLVHTLLKINCPDLIN